MVMENRLEENLLMEKYAGDWTMIQIWEYIIILKIFQQVKEVML